MVRGVHASPSNTKASCETKADLRAKLAAAEAKLAALQQTKKEAPKKKRAADDSASTVQPKKQKAAAAMPTEIIDELVAINRLPYDKQGEAKLNRPEWFEFLTNWGRSDREVRKKAHELLHGTPGMTKSKLCEASGISGIGLLNKFLENKSRNCAQDSLCTLINILEGEAEGGLKRRRRLQSMLKHGMTDGKKCCMGISGGERIYADAKWPREKLERFRKAFPTIELEYGDKWWQVGKDHVWQQ